jgi:hypothetical protein
VGLRSRPQIWENSDLFWFVVGCCQNQQKAKVFCFFFSKKKRLPFLESECASMAEELVGRWCDAGVVVQDEAGEEFVGGFGALAGGYQELLGGVAGAGPEGEKGDGAEVLGAQGGAGFRECSRRQDQGDCGAGFEAAGKARDPGR